MIASNNKGESSIIIINTSSNLFLDNEPLCFVAIDYSISTLKIWNDLVVGKKIIIAQSIKSPAFKLATIVGKGVNEEHNHTLNSLIIYYQPISVTNNFRDKDEGWRLQPYTYTNEVYNWEILPKKPITKVNDLINLDSYEGEISNYQRYTVKLVTTEKQLKNISEWAEAHTFGKGNYDVALICYFDEEPISAVLLSFPKERKKRIRDRSIFSNSEYIKQGTVCISRLISKKGVRVSLKFNSHYVLALAAEQASKDILGLDLTILEGVSYDYHPMAKKAGFYCHAPRDHNGTFYFWKPLNIFDVDHKHSMTFVASKEKVKVILGGKMESDAWLIKAGENILEKSIEHSIWCLKKDTVNTSMWKMVKEGDCLFFYDQQYRKIIGYATAKRYKSKIIKGYEAYSLCIEIIEGTFSKESLDVSKVSEIIDSQRKKGGICRISAETEHHLKSLISESNGGSTMWVTPNPYLLHHGAFSVVPKSVFLVQAFSLNKRVYPVLKEILENEGYSIKFSGDRDGQVIFNDIWKLLNESESVLVDFTEKRPNVYLEFGMALVLGKPIIAITQNPDDIPSDTPNLKYMIYSDRMGDETLKQSLVKKIEDTIEDIETLKS